MNVQTSAQPSLAPLSWIQRHPLGIFFTLSLVCGWLLTLLVAQLPTSPLLLVLLALPISYAPALAAIFVLRVAGTTEERQAFRRRLTTWRVDWRWYALALVTLPAIHLVSLAIATQFGGQFPFSPAMFALFPLYAAINLGEEIGWRAYALPKLQARFNVLTASLILGFIWGAFHWVAALANPEQPLAYLVVSTIFLMGMSVLMAFVFNHAKQSILVVTLMHAAANTVQIGVSSFISTGIPLLAYTIATVVLIIAVVLLVARTGPNLGAQ